MARLVGRTANRRALRPRGRQSDGARVLHAGVRAGGARGTLKRGDIRVDARSAASALETHRVECRPQFLNFFDAARHSAEYAPARVFAEVPAPMLARLESSLPRGAEWRYEPKLDGFRGMLWRSGTGQVRLLSRNLKDLSPCFPELVRAGDSLPEGSVLDGEIVIADDKGYADFGALQQRLGVRRRATSEVALGKPAVLLAFDVVRRGGADLASCPLRKRRAMLE